VTALLHTVITPPRRFSLPPWREFWHAREVFHRFGMRDITLRYRQTALGVSWVVIQPLLAAGIFALVFGGVADLPSDGIPYFLFSFAGMLGWNAFSQVIGRSSGSLVANQSLVSKVFFPRMLVPLSSIVSVLVDFVVALALGIALLVAFGINPGWPVLLVPVWILLLLMMASGVGLISSALMVKYRDVQYIVPFITQMLLYASPVAYSLSAVPDRLRWIYDINPLSWVFEGMRWSFLGLAAPPPWQMVAAVLTAVIVFVGGAVVFQQMERGFADVI
jgi:lipopolysaccharide transport system permease protein